MEQRTLYLPLLQALLLAVLCSCTSSMPTPKDLSAEALIPQPVSVQATGSSFALSEQTRIHWGNDERLQPLANQLAAYLRPATGFPLPIEQGETTPQDDFVYLRLVEDEELGEEGYELTITESGLTLAAQAPAGIFYGIQTLRQLLPPRIEADAPQQGPWEIATGSLRDFPQYAYRGSMLDVARHFFPVEDVKRYIDLMAMYKLNVLHLHLTDDQGWRIEITAWPRLTEHGGSTEVGGGAGGYFTQEQYTELVNYAAERFITIVPEIDVPGHTNAALASYPELNCDGKARELYTGTEVGFSTLCTSKEVVYQFMEDVIRELAAITPGPYLHIGGDESLVTEKPDYIAFVERVQDMVLAQGKQMIGWDEIVEAELKPGAVAQYWAKAEHAQKAVEQSARVIMSPASRTYMDMKYDSTTQLGLSWAGLIEVDHGYQWQPDTLVEGVRQEHILGIEAPLWTETITNMDELEYMVFPRLMGYAEIAWSPGSALGWEGYRQRLAQQEARLEALGINFYRSPKVPWGE